jgi:putative PIN family toxin of toxin-antitoxin system
MSESQIRAVIDTNVFVSGLISPHSGSAEIIRYWREQRRFIPIVSRELLGEIYRILGHPKIAERYHIAENERQRLIRQLYVRSIYVTPTGRLRICRDPDDDFLIEAAILGLANYLVTGDPDLQDCRVTDALHKFGIKVVSIGQFLRALR